MQETERAWAVAEAKRAILAWVFIVALSLLAVLFAASFFFSSS